MRIGYIFLFLLLLGFFIVVIYFGVTNENMEEVHKTLEIQLDMLAKIPDKIYEIPYKIYYINLDRSTERRAFMEAQFEKYHVDYQRVSAVDGQTLDITKYKHNHLTKYEIACSLSHYNAIKMAYDEGNENAIIMEDDCHFGVVKLWKEPIEETLKDVPSDWEVIQLFTTLTNHRKYSPVKVSTSTVCYMINRKGMEKILQYFQDQKILSVSDVYLYDETKAYTLFPSLFITSDFILPSTIHHQHQNFHIISIVKQLGHILKDTKP
jgi:GR25 family glycosyltransferase involved in LPS biosynthesis